MGHFHGTVEGYSMCDDTVATRNGRVSIAKLSNSDCNSFARNEDESTNELRVDVIHSTCSLLNVRVGLSRVSGLDHVTTEEQSKHENCWGRPRPLNEDSRQNMASKDVQLPRY